MSVELTVGDLTFDTASLMKLQLHTGVDTIYGSLQGDSMEAVVRADAPAEAQALQEQKVKLYSDGSLLATQCLKSCTRTGSREFTLSCQSDMEFLEGQFMGGMYSNMDPLLLVDQILAGRSFTMDAAVMNRSVTGYLPVCSRAKALRQVAFALGAVVSMDKNGRFSFNAPDLSAAGIIGPERILAGSKLRTTPAYSKVELVSHKYTASSRWVELFRNRDYGADPVTLTFAQPYAAYDFEEGTLLDSGPNFVTFQPGTVTTLLARPYVHTTAYHTVEEPAAESGYSHVLSVRDMTLVNPSNAQQVLKWLHERAQMGQQLTVKVMVEAERAGQQVALSTPWGSTFTGYISKMESTLTDSAHVAQLTVNGSEQ